MYLLASCVPLRAVVPSLLTNSLKLLSEENKKSRRGVTDAQRLSSNLTPKNWNPVKPSLLLMSEKFWLWIIFSTMSSASMRVSSTQLGCLSTLSFFLLLLGRTNTNWGKMYIWNTPTLHCKIAVKLLLHTANYHIKSAEFLLFSVTPDHPL